MKARSNRFFLQFFLSMTAVLLCGCYDQGNRNSGPSVNYAPANTNMNSAPNTQKSNTNTEMQKEKGRREFNANLPEGFSPPVNSVETTLLREYGAMFVARGVGLPTKIVFKDEADVSSFQLGLKTASETINGITVELQAAAMEDLRKAIAEAKSEGLSITPRDVDAARRSYDETVGLWNSRVEPALKHWVANGRLTQQDADRISAMTPFEQVPEVLKLEEKGIYFAKDLSKSIIYSVAPPGTSQHLSMLAFDVKEYDDKRVRSILAKYHWFQTVVSDLPHFTYLGVAEDELPRLGLKKVTSGERTFWIPDV